MANLLSLSFWFKMNPGNLTTFSQNTLVVLIIVFVLISVVSYFKQKRTGESKKFILVVWRKMYSMSLTNAFLGLFLLFFCYQRIYFFSSRFWFLVWAIEVAVWLFFIFKAYKEIPLKIEQAEKEERYNKYIP